MLEDLSKTLELLEQSRLITLKGEHIELAHDALATVIEGKLSAEEKAIAEWKKLVKNKFQASIQSGKPDFLTDAQLSGLIPYEKKLTLSGEERLYIRESREESKKRGQLIQKKKRRKLIFAFLIILLLFISWISALHNKGITDKAIIEHERIISGMYFYEDNFALCMKSDTSGHFKYGFMDKEGNIRIPYIYDEAGQFDDYGFARVKIKDKLYLLDTNNVLYPLAETVKALNKNITALRLNEQELDVIPDEIFEQSQLKVLALRGNFLSEIPEDINKLKSLISLDLSDNNLILLPEEIAELSSLTILDIRNNYITDFPIFITQLQGLQYLNMSSNNLEIIPSETGQLINLKILDLSDNNLSEIERGIEKIISLEGLNLYNNNLKDLPEQLVKKTDIIINFGGRRMKRQEKNTKYHNNKYPEVKHRDSVNRFEDTYLPEEIDFTDESKTDTTNTKTAVNNIDTLIEEEKISKDSTESKEEKINTFLQEGFVTISKSKTREWKIKLTGKSPNYKFIVMVSGNSSSNLYPIQKGMKIEFVAGFERMMANFHYKIATVNVNGRPGLINSFVLKRKDIVWMANNLVSMMVFENRRSGNKHPCNFDIQSRVQWQNYVKDFLKKN